MATHSSFLAWGIPWTEEPGRLQSMVSQKSQICLSTTLVCRRRRNRERSRLTLPRFYQGKVIWNQTEDAWEGKVELNVWRNDLCSRSLLPSCCLRLYSSVHPSALQSICLIFSSQPTQMLCGMRKDVEAHISIKSKMSLLADNCSLSCLCCLMASPPAGSLHQWRVAQTSLESISTPIVSFGLPRDLRWASVFSRWDL